jgi:hypothetical protein
MGLLATRRIDVVPFVARSIWPTPAQLCLLRAALWPGDDARAAWAEWPRLENPAAIDGGSWNLLPLVWRNLSAQGVTDELLEECRGFHRYHWAHNQQLLRRAAGWVAEWRAQGVPVAVLKGAALAAGTYADPGMRPMADVDLLVPLAHAPAVGARLQAAGWRPEKTGPRWEDVSFATMHSVNWERGAERLDLHWHVLHRCTRAEITELFWARSRPLALPGAAAVQLAPEDALLHVCSHGVQYAVQPPFRWLADAAWILRRAGAEFDWSRVTAMAGRTGTTLALREGLGYAADELRLPVPAGVLAALRSRRVSARERWAFRRTTDPAEGNRWIRACNLVELLWRVGGTGAPWTRWARMRRFLCARWAAPDLRGVLGLAWRKIRSGHRGTLQVDLP